MTKFSKNITTRSFKGSSVPVGSKMGKILISSKDSAKVANAIRATVKGDSRTVTLSKSTISSLKAARK